MVSLGVGVGVGAMARPVSRSTMRFNPQSLFASGERGVLLNLRPDHLFQSLDGLEPVVNAGDPVALALSNINGAVIDPSTDTLGPELSSRTSGTFQPGSAVDLTAPAIVGAIYRLTYTITASDFTGDLFLRPASGPFAYRVLKETPGTYTYFVTAEDTQTEYMRFGGGNSPTGSITFESISLRQAFNGHAVQAINTNMRPTWRNNPPHLAFDQVEDALSILLPDLGASVTEFWSTDAGIGIHTGLTVAAGARALPSASKLFAYGMVDRSLTDGEQTGLAVYLNALGGA